MKVLQITTNYPCKENPIFGIFMKEQVESVEKFGVENTIFFSNGLKARHGIVVHLQSAVKLAANLLTHRYDVIHCHNVLAGMLLMMSGGMMANGKRTVLSLQNDPEFKGTHDSRFTKYVYPRVAKVIVKKQLRSKEEKYVYLPNGVNMELFRPMDKTECKRRLGLDPEKRYILFVDSNVTKGRTQKRIDRYHEAMELLRTKYGHTDIEPLVMTKTLRDDVPLWMNASELYLLTSDEEGSPNAVKECMACNVPVVATPVGNIPDLFEGVKDCRMSRGLDAGELAEAAHEVLISTEPVDTRSAIVAKGLDMDSIAARLYDIYTEVADRK